VGEDGNGRRGRKGGLAGWLMGWRYMPVDGEKWTGVWRARREREKGKFNWLYGWSRGFRKCTDSMAQAAAQAPHTHIHIHVLISTVTVFFSGHKTTQHGTSPFFPPKSSGFLFSLYLLKKRGDD